MLILYLAKILLVHPHNHPVENKQQQKRKRKKGGGGIIASSCSETTSKQASGIDLCLFTRKHAQSLQYFKAVSLHTLRFSKRCLQFIRIPALPALPRSGEKCWPMAIKIQDRWIFSSKKKKKKRFFELFLPNEKAACSPALYFVTLSGCTTKTPLARTADILLPCVRGTGFREDRKQLPEAGAGVIITECCWNSGPKRLLPLSIYGRFFPCQSNVDVDLHDARKY